MPVDMLPPAKFVVLETFRHTRPEAVRDIALAYGFERRTVAGTARSEVWVKPDTRGGFWLIRLDSMGHDTTRHFGSRPHYHKNWVSSEALLQEYMERFTPLAWIYSDEGIIVGLAGAADDMHSDRKAKIQHIPR